MARSNVGFWRLFKVGIKANLLTGSLLGAAVAFAFLLFAEFRGAELWGPMAPGALPRPMREFVWLTLIEWIGIPVEGAFFGAKFGFALGLLPTISGALAIAAGIGRRVHLALIALIAEPYRN